jgi:hypothetical protein
MERVVSHAFVLAVMEQERIDKDLCVRVQNRIKKLALLKLARV